MSEWKGYLIKAIATDTILNGELLKVSSYKVTPDQREELEAYRDDNSRDLTRITAEGTKTKITFETLDELSFSEFEELKDFFYNAESDHLQRKIELEFFDTELLEYKQGFFYRTDPEHTIKQYDERTCLFTGYTITLVEY